MIIYNKFLLNTQIPVRLLMCSVQVLLTSQLPQWVCSGLCSEDTLYGLLDQISMLVSRLGSRFQSHANIPTDVGRPDQLINKQTSSKS